MKRFGLYIGSALLAFVLGAVAATLWKSHPRSAPPPTVSKESAQEERPLTTQIVSRSLRSHSFRTDKLPRNSNDEIVWLWLKESIAGYPQDWLKLNISDDQSYGVMLYPIRVLESRELDSYNRELNDKGLPSLTNEKHYLPIDVYAGDLICPSWSGLIDVEETKLVYFAGGSG